MRIALPIVLATVLAGSLRAEPPHAATTFNVRNQDLPDPLVLVAYGDMRFTNAGQSSDR